MSINLDVIRKELKNDIIKLDESYDFFLTGNPILDAYVGSGGLPKYQAEYFWGLNSIGKSTLAIQILASYQRQYGDNCIVVYFDKEQSVTRLRLERLGVDVEKLLMVNPICIEKVTEILKHIKTKLTKKNKNVKIFSIWDTLAMTPSLEEYSGNGKIGSHARGLNDFFKNVDFSRLNLTMLILDQHREKIGNKWEELQPPSANIVKHKSFLTINGKAKKSVMLDNNDIGRTVTFNTVKSKIVSPKRKFEFEMTYVGGYDAILSMFNYMTTQMKIMKRKGSVGCAGCWVIDGFSEKMRLDDWYEYFMTDESVDFWKNIIDNIFDTLYPYDYRKIINDGKERIYNYYFNKNKFNADRFTSLNLDLIKNVILYKYNSKQNKDDDLDIIENELNNMGIEE